MKQVSYYRRLLVEKLAAGKSLAEVNEKLSKLSFSDMQVLMRVLSCEIGDLAIKAAQAQGIKCSKAKKQSLSKA